MHYMQPVEVEMRCNQAVDKSEVELGSSQRDLRYRR